MAVKTFELLKLIKMVRPITGGENGIAALAFSKGGRLYSFYRNVMLSVPVPEGFPEFVVKGDSLIKAATDKSSLSVSATRLTLTSGKLKTWLQLDNESMLPEPIPSSDFTQVPEGLAKLLKEMDKLVPQEAPRLWATSLLLKGSYAYATDGTYILRRKLDVQLPFACALPKSLVQVLAKLNKPLATTAFDGKNFYVTFNDGSRLSSPVYAEPWPDVSNFFMAEEMQPANSEMLEFLEQVKPYAADGVTVNFVKPNMAGFRVGETEATATFESSWIPRNFTTSLKHILDFIEPGAQIAFADRYMTVKYDDRTIIISAKEKMS